VLNVDCRARELDSFYVVDTSFFPSISAVNPPWAKQDGGDARLARPNAVTRRRTGRLNCLISVYRICA
jgi:hypothetical protein